MIQSESVRPGMVTQRQLVWRLVRLPKVLFERLGGTSPTIRSRSFPKRTAGRVRGDSVGGYDYRDD